MFAVIGAVIFSALAIMTVLVAAGLPLGEFTMGGQYRILPKRLRILAVVSVLIQLFAVVIVLQAGGHLPLWFSYSATRILCFVFSVYLTLNILMNMRSKSRKEKTVMTPLSLIAAVCFWITALQM